MFSDFFASSREAMFVTSRDGRFVEANASMHELLGYPPGALGGTLVADALADAEDRDPYVELIEREGRVHDYPLALRTAAGAPLPCLVDAIAWREGGKVAGYHGIVRSRDAFLESFSRCFNALEAKRESLEAERRNLVADTLLLSRYLGDELVDFVRETGRNPLGADMRKATILFFDIRNSTGIAEAAGPEDFAAFLNDILVDVMDLVCGAKGSVNKLVGDGLLATFGCPLPSGDDAFRAASCALEIRKYLELYNDVRPSWLAKPVRAGVGIATGRVFAGVIGSVRRQEYTVLGDPVNVASRLEALTKQFDYDILVDEGTHEEIARRIECVKILDGRLRGREKPLSVYGILGEPAG